MDMKILKQFIKSEVTEIYDHKNLNLDVPDFKTTIPTAENIARAIYERLRVHITAPLELKIKLYETSRNFVEYPA
jgi:6-pyruvoyltetrahydropterin/6-carboxytetrahydropterin synthase